MEGYLVVPRLSIIIPGCGDQQALDNTLVSVLENRPADCEVLVACGTSYRDPYDLEDEVHFVRTDNGLGWDRLVMTALSASRAAIVHVLYPGVEVRKGWAEPAIAVMQCDRSVGAISPVIEEAGRSARACLVTGVQFSGLGNRRVAHAPLQEARQLAKVTVAGPSFMAGFYRREALRSVGSWDTAMGPWNADIDLGLRLANKGWRCRVEPACRCAADVRAVQASMGRASFHQGVGAEQLCRRHREQLSRLAAVCHYPAGIALALAQLPSPKAVAQIMGRMLGWLIPAATAQEMELCMTDETSEPADYPQVRHSPADRNPRTRRAA